MVNRLKSEKGITLISLIVYVIVMLIVVTIVGTITSYFYANVNDEYNKSKNNYSETNLDLYLSNDLKNKEVLIKTNELADVPIEGSKNIILIYDNESIVYTITNDAIYRNSVKIYSFETGLDLKFVLGEELPSSSESKIYEKQKLQILKDGTVFKSYIVSTKTKLVY